MLKLVLSVVAVAFLAGGGYFFFAPNAKDLNLMQYIPESIASYLPGGAETEVVDLSTLSTEPFLEGSNDQVEELSPQVTEVNNESETVEVDSRSNTDTADVSDSLVEEKVEQTTEIAIQSITQQAVEPKIKTEVIEKAQTQEIANKAPEVIKLENKLVDMNSSVTQLDDENERLQKKFKEMLKKNKDLAITLGHLEEKLKTSN